MTSSIRISYDGMQEHEMTSFQSLFFYYILGKLLVEHGKTGDLKIMVSKETQSCYTEGTIKIKIYNVKDYVTRVYLDLFPFKQDINPLSHKDDFGEYSGYLVYPREIVVKPETLMTITFPCKRKFSV